MKIVRKQKGFTLIELVIVIVILGILAAVAIPRYIRIVGDARKASVNGLAGGLRGAVTLARAKYMVVGDNTAGTVDMDGTPVTVQVGSGVPLGTQAGIVTALTETTGYDVRPITSPTVTFWPTNGGSDTCCVVYSGPTTSATPAVITTILSDCGV